MKEFINKWSNWWILNPKRKELDDAFEKELNELVEKFGTKKAKEVSQSVEKFGTKIAVNSMIVLLIALSSCNVTRIIKTEASHFQKGDTTTTIVTKTTEIYEGTKK